MNFWDAVAAQPAPAVIAFLFALLVAFGFEFINGFHDTANAVATVIYTRTLRPTPAVVYSGVMNFFGVLFGGTGVAFGVVNLLPVDVLVDAHSSRALVMVVSLLLAGVLWNLGTWWVGLPVSSSHTLIGAILGVGIANGLMSGQGLNGVRWDKAGETGLALLFSPLVGFAASAALLWVFKKAVRDPKLYVPPEGEDRPPKWVRGVLLLTCGGVSYAHGSNDGQKGMGLIMLVLIGFLSGYFALDIENNPRDPRESKVERAREGVAAVRAGLEAKGALTDELAADADAAATALDGKTRFAELPAEARWELRQRYVRLKNAANAAGLRAGEGEKHPPQQALADATEYVPFLVILGVALALSVGTTIGYKRIVVTVAEKIGKAHLAYAQGAAAEIVAAITILLATFVKLPVSTTQVLSSGVAGTMAANGNGLQGKTARRILLAWAFTLPCTAALSGGLFALGRLVFG